MRQLDELVQKLGREYRYDPPRESMIAKATKMAAVRAEAARLTVARLARDASLDIERASSRLPWPLGRIARSAAHVAHLGAEHLDPTPPGAMQAEYLSITLRTLSANPRRMAVREAAAAYAQDLVHNLPESHRLLARAKNLRAALDEFPNDDFAKADELESHVKRLREGSGGRVVVEAAIADLRSKALEVRTQLSLEADFWSYYAAGSR
jgi:hypothetical protein